MKRRQHFNPDVRAVEAAILTSERKWGVCRLPLLVRQPTMQAWDRGFDQWQRAIRADDWQQVATLAPQLITALDFMDQEATQDGAWPATGNDLPLEAA